MKYLQSTYTTTHRIDRVVGAAFVLCAMAAVWTSAASATAPIYKCLDRKLGIVYTDIPCKDGEVMDVRAGDADPAAVARLERERDALDRSAAQRITDMRRAALRQQYSVAPDDVPAYDATPYANATDYFPYGYGVLAYAPMARHHPPSARSERRSARQSVVLNRMPVLPR
jgi:hypothetical protein